MAEMPTNAFLSFSSGSADWTDLYQTPFDRRTIGSSLQVANTAGSAGNSAYFSARVVDYTSGSTYELLKDAEVPICTAMDAFTKHVVLLGLDKLQVASTTGSCAFTFSGIEIS